MALNLNSCVSLPSAGVIGCATMLGGFTFFGIDPAVYVDSTFLFVDGYRVLFYLEQSVGPSALSVKCLSLKLTVA